MYVHMYIKKRQVHVCMYICSGMESKGRMENVNTKVALVRRVTYVYYILWFFFFLLLLNMLYNISYIVC